LKTIINGEYYNNLVIESLYIIFYIILLCLEKYITMIVAIKWFIWFNQHSSKSQRPKSTRII